MRRHHSLRRALRLPLVICLLIVALPALAAPASAAPPPGTPVPCDAAVLAADIANANATGGGTFDLAAGCTYTFTAPDNYFFGPNALPVIQAAITIHGHGATLTRSGAGGTPPFRLFAVSGGVAGIAAGSLTLDALTLANGLAKGGTRGRAAGSAGWAGRSSAWGRWRSSAAR